MCNSLKILYLSFFDPATWPRPLMACKALGEKNVIIKYVGPSSFSLLKIAPIRQARALLKAYSALNFGNMTDGAVFLNANPWKLTNSSLFRRRPYVVDLMDVFLNEKMELPQSHIDFLKGAKGVIFWSKAVMKLLSNQLDIPAHTYIPAGIDLGLFHKTIVDYHSGTNKQHNREKLVTYFGYLFRKNGREIQGVYDLIEAMAVVEKEIEHVRLIVSGVTLDKDLLRVVKNSGIRKITFLDSVPYGSTEFQHRLNVSNVLVLPTTSNPIVSYAEQHKIFIYMAARKPIVATDTPGTRGVLNEKTAVLASADKPASIASGIVRTLSDSELAMKIADNAYNHLAQNYTWNKLIPKYNDFVLGSFLDFARV